VVGAAAEVWSQVEALFDKGNMADWAELMTDDVVAIDPNGRHEGREEYRAYVGAWDNVLTDSKMETSLLLEDGDVFVVEWTVRRSVSGPIPLPDGTELAPTGRTVDYGGVTVATLRDGKIASMRDYYDTPAPSESFGVWRRWSNSGDMSSGGGPSG
jgi:ketosteroid isomerase-like protein